MLSPAAQSALPRNPDLRTLLSTPGSRLVLLDGSRDPNSGVTVLVTEPGSAEPQLAVKIATTAAAAEVIAREARLLAELHPRPLPRVDRTLPRHLGVFDADGMLASVTSVVPGVPMRTSYHEFRHVARPDSVRGDFAAAQDWLTALHADSMTEAAPITLLDGVAPRIAARWPDDPRTPDLDDQLGALTVRLSSAGTRRTVVHGDFWAGNLLIRGGTVTGVVDWAAADLAGEPLRDVVRFALSYSLSLDRHTRRGRPVPGHPGLRADGWGAGIRYALSGYGWYGQLVRCFVENALVRVGGPAGLWRAALLAGLGEIAATADHADFAIRHRDLLMELTSEAPL
jgi:aminoglycoside phosphotransferase (APT) family kinase protein